MNYKCERWYEQQRHLFSNNISNNPQLVCVNGNFDFQKRVAYKKRKGGCSWRIGWLLCHPDRTYARKERMLACFIAKGCW
jgi:hypothetical protein